MGSKYRCGWVGRGIQPPSTPNAPPLQTQTHTQKASKTLVFPLFDSIMDGQTDGQTDRRTDSYRVACPQLKRDWRNFDHGETRPDTWLRISRLRVVRSSNLSGKVSNGWNVSWQGLHCSETSISTDFTSSNISHFWPSNIGIISYKPNRSAVACSVSLFHTQIHTFELLACLLPSSLCSFVPSLLPSFLPSFLPWETTYFTLKYPKCQNRKNVTDRWMGRWTKQGVELRSRN